MIRARRPEPGAGRPSDVLIDENRVAVRIDRHETCRPRRVLIGLAHELHALRLASGNGRMLAEVRPSDKPVLL